MFFLWRAAWNNSWWRRGLSGLLLASAVSGMHWCAATGTEYRLVRLSSTSTSERMTIVVVITVLSFVAALIVIGVATYGNWVTRSNTSKARSVVLAAAVFDRSGRILVSPDGLLPSEKVTDTYIEKASSDTFSIENPLFQWMFQASRNWSDISGMVASMSTHLVNLTGHGRGRSIRLISDNGQIIEHYDVILQELFCLAAATLATRLKAQLVNAGVLWDDILPTGNPRAFYPLKEDMADASERGESMSIRTSTTGSGSLMFLVRRLEHASDVEKLEAAGYRFADIRQVSGIIRSNMQIMTPDLDLTLTNMAIHAEQNTMMDPLVHLGFFGIRPRLNGCGFDILVERGARNLLPAAKLPFKRLEPWHTDFLQQYDGFKISSLQRTLMDPAKNWSIREGEFASCLATAVSTLLKRVGDRVFDEATLSCRTVQVPCRPRPASETVEETTMVVVHLVIPIHYSLQSSSCEFIPLSFFKIHQMAHKNSPYQAAFTQHLHREFAPALKVLPSTVQKTSRQWGWQQNFRSGTRALFGSRRHSAFIDGDGNPIPTHVRSKLSGSNASETGSSLRLWSPEKNHVKGLTKSMSSNESLSDGPVNINQRLRTVPSLGGILVSQEVTVAISRAEEIRSQASSRLSGHSQDKVLQRPPQVHKHSPQNSRHLRMKSEKEQQRIELVSLPNIRSTQRPSRPRLGTTAAASGRDSEMMTFVDELFSTCIELR
ncbi:hypothetical protein F4808DRAFT_244769 [Astrocystis sublimbata]|nr:hypothetical protein F4808DRAFT_244769 [Astrocystis sublimbata]